MLPMLHATMITTLLRTFDSWPWSCIKVEPTRRAGVQRNYSFMDGAPKSISEILADGALIDADMMDGINDSAAPKGAIASHTAPIHSDIKEVPKDEKEVPLTNGTNGSDKCAFPNSDVPSGVAEDEFPALEHCISLSIGPVMDPKSSVSVCHGRSGSLIIRISIQVGKCTPGA